MSKYWRPISYDEYKDKLDIIDVQNAVEIAGIPKAVADKIWKRSRGAFEVF